MTRYKSKARCLASGATVVLQAGLALLLLAATGCERGKKEDAKAATPPPPPPGVVVAEVQQRPVEIKRDFVARTQGIPTVDVRARVAGVLENVFYKEGTEVKQGQVLFELQREEYAAAVESARAQL